MITFTLHYLLLNDRLAVVVARINSTIFHNVHFTILHLVWLIRVSQGQLIAGEMSNLTRLSSTTNQ